MTHGEITSAYAALIALRSQRVPAAVAWDIWEMVEKCGKIVDFQAVEERKIIEEMGLQVDTDGNVKFDNKETADEFVRRIGEIHDLPAEIGTYRITIDLDDLAYSGLSISALEMQQLSGLVTFRKGGKDLVHS